MAKLAGTILFTGTIGELTAYKRHDSDAVIVRQKGGPTKKQIKYGRRFGMVRRNMAEFGGRARATRWLREATRPVHLSGDTKFTSRIGQLMKSIQVNDTVSELGERGIPFSKFPKLFEGFNFNRYNSLDAIIRNPLHYTIVKETLTATVSLPALLPGVNFNMPFTHPFSRITLALGLLPDLEFGQHEYQPIGYKEPHPLLAEAETDWFPSLEGMPARDILLQLPVAKAPAIYTLVLSAGIITGKVTGMNNGINLVKYAGAAKILAME
jgi:hypothetical protein